MEGLTIASASKGSGISARGGDPDLDLDQDLEHPKRLRRETGNEWRMVQGQAQLVLGMVPCGRVPIVGS